ncbi:hypothetical protein UBN86_15140 [Helicobacter pylori]
MEKLIQNYPNQREIFEKAIKNGVILASGVCFSMYKDFKNQASWERNQKTEEYHNALRNLKDFYPDAFNSDDKSKESLLFLSNMGAIEERLEKAAKEKEKNHVSKIARLCTEPSKQPPFINSAVITRPRRRKKEG